MPGPGTCINPCLPLCRDLKICLVHPFPPKRRSKKFQVAMSKHERDPDGDQRDVEEEVQDFFASQQQQQQQQQQPAHGHNAQYFHGAQLPGFAMQQRWPPAAVAPSDVPQRGVVPRQSVNRMVRLFLGNVPPVLRPVLQPLPVDRRRPQRSDRDRSHPRRRSRAASVARRSPRPTSRGT